MKPSIDRLAALAVAWCVLLAAVGVGVAVAPGIGTAAAVDDGNETDAYAVDTAHGLDNSEAFSEFDTDGHATGEIEGLNAEITVGERREYVDESVDILHAGDLREDYLRIQYREETTRTLRILIPEQLVDPYDRDSVESVGWSDAAVADVSKAREGDYLEVIITIQGESDIVLPLSKHAQFTSEWISKHRERVDAVNPLTESEEWTYAPGDELENGSVTFEVDDPSNAVVQHDYKTNGEAFVPTPRDGVGEDGVYYYVDSHDRGEGFVIRIVSHSDDPPTVRYKADAQAADRFSGWRNDAERIPERIGELLPDDVFPWS